jgi:hypothetical protein
MPFASLNSLDGRLYRAALSLFPPAFRRDHGAEMARDFEDARQEANNHRSIWLLRGCMAIDLVRTLAVQWVRTKVPAIAAASFVLSIAIAEGIAAAARSVAVPMPHGIENEDTVVVLFMAQMTVVLIATTILLSLWVGRQMRPRRR